MKTSPSVAEPRVPLSRERVLQVAVELAAREGIESLSMRRPPGELGSGAMSLYHYVPHKDQTLDAKVDIVLAEIQLPPTRTDRGTARGLGNEPQHPWPHHDRPP